jgi:hypothetical protein
VRLTGGNHTPEIYIGRQGDNNGLPVGKMIREPFEKVIL